LWRVHQPRSPAAACGSDASTAAPDLVVYQ
jgi:hypothetical protein